MSNSVLHVRNSTFDIFVNSQFETERLHVLIGYMMHPPYTNYKNNLK